MHILIVEDDPDQLTLLQGFLKHQGYTAYTALEAKTAEEIFASQPIQVVLLDQRMPDISGEELLARLKGINPLLKAIMITAYASVDIAVEVMKLGAVDFLEKPVDLQILLKKLKDLDESLQTEEEASEVAESIQKSELPLNIVGNSPAMYELLSLVKRVAPTPWTVLISGETGTGKGLLAKLIHELSPRKEEPLIEVNCAAIPESLFESELFGHVKGAFTGAEKNKKGRFELADQGSLFLDEIGELPESMQAKMLQALQEGKISKVGSEDSLSVDVRLIAATNRNLKEMVDQGRFREDLYYRLNVLNLDLPPLREHREDIAELIEYFLKRYTAGKVKLSEQALNTLVKYHYPGNVRELEHLIQRIGVLVRGSTIKQEDLPQEVRFHSAASQGKLKQRLEAVEKEMISQAMQRHSGNQSQAARELGISERVMRYKLSKYEIKTERV